MRTFKSPKNRSKSSFSSATFFAGKKESSFFKTNNSNSFFTPQRLDKPIIQRLAADQSPALSDISVKEEEETPVQPLKFKPDMETPGISESQLSREKGKGEALPESSLSQMQSAFGTDLKDVRIHRSRKASAMADSIQAKAFTYGSDIFFNKGEYQPGTKNGDRVIAHELTHVMQQSGNSLSRSGQGGTAKIQRLGGLGRQLSSGIAPWSTPHPIGTNYEVTTDAGSTVTGWVAYSPYANNLRYWCHGHSLSTYNNDPMGFSIYSGANDMGKVIADEWTNIAPANTQAGDIAVWTNKWNHSAKFVNPVINSGALDPEASMLTTKNGQAALQTMSLNQIAAVPGYGAAGIAVYRKK